MKKLIFACTILVALTSFRNAAPPADKAFMIKAAQSNIAEIAVAQLALQKSSSDSVKSFAQMMIDDHTQAQTQLASLAQSQGVTLPDSTDSEHRMFAQRLMLVSGNTFDSAYVQSQIKDHVKAVSLFKVEANKGLNADDKAFAVKLLPKLQMHLQMAQNLGNMQQSNTGTQQ